MKPLKMKLLTFGFKLSKQRSGAYTFKVAYGDILGDNTRICE